MENIMIILKDIVGEKAIEPNRGEDIRNLIVSNINDGNSVTVDFQGIKAMLSLFLNPAIGDLYGELPSETIKERFKVINVPSEYALTLKKVIERAKQFYSNESTIAKIANEEMHNDENM